jgi:hypothetical protein
MDPDVIQEFKAVHSLKEAEELPMQHITAANTFEADGKMYSLDGLTPVNVFTAGATYMADGEEMESLPEPAAFLKMEGEDMLLVTQDVKKDKMRTIDIVHTDGSTTYMEELSEGVVATVLPESRDRDTLNKFVMAHREIDENGDVKYEDEMEQVEADESNNDWTRKLFESAGVDTDEKRKLQSGCSSFRVIEVAIAYESSYCSDMGGASNANAAVQQIVAKASTLYQNNFCAKIEISHLEGFCNSGSDPYRAGVLLNNSGCGSTGLLDFFASFWSSNRGSISRDSAHLFSGTGLECSGNSCVIGCATRPSLCSSSTSYGVNFITFNNDSQMQANLFAHELAHNAGTFSKCDSIGLNSFRNSMLTISLARRQVLLTTPPQTALSSLWSQASTVDPTALASNPETPLLTTSTPEAASVLCLLAHLVLPQDLPPQDLPPQDLPPQLLPPQLLRLAHHVDVAHVRHLFSSVMLVVTVVWIESTGLSRPKE